MSGGKPATPSDAEPLPIAEAERLFREHRESCISVLQVLANGLERHPEEVLSWDEQRMALVVVALRALAGSETTRALRLEDHLKIWQSEHSPSVNITLEIPGVGFWSYNAPPDDDEGDRFALQFKEFFKVKGIER